MKKTIAMITTAVLSAAMLAGCGTSRPIETAPAATESTTVAQTAAETEEATETEETAAAENSGETKDDVIIRVGGLKGPTTMGLVKLIDDAEKGETQNQYEFTMVTAADELTALVASGQVDIALLPANVASVLYNRTDGGVTVVDINTLGVLYMVSADTSVTSMDQLAGRTVYLPGKGTTPEFTIRYLISAAGLGEDDVSLEFCSEATEVASILAENPEAIGMLPQPFVTAALAQNDALSIVMDMTEVWDSVQSDDAGSRLITGATIVNAEFLNAHNDLVDTFLEEHEASIRFAEEEPDTTAELIAAQGIVAQGPLAKRALPYCNICFIAGGEMKDALTGYLGVLFEQNPQSVGGALPDDAFYYIP